MNIPLLDILDLIQSPLVKIIYQGQELYCGEKSLIYETSEHLFTDYQVAGNWTARLAFDDLCVDTIDIEDLDTIVMVCY